MTEKPFASPNHLSESEEVLSEGPAYLLEEDEVQITNMTPGTKRRKASNNLLEDVCKYEQLTLHKRHNQSRNMKQSSIRSGFVNARGRGNDTGHQRSLHQNQRSQR